MEVLSSARIAETAFYSLTNQIIRQIAIHCVAALGRGLQPRLLERDQSRRRKGKNLASLPTEPQRRSRLIFGNVDQ